MAGGTGATWARPRRSPPACPHPPTHKPLTPHTHTHPARALPGGLTAAIIDESYGGLLFALKKAGALSFWGPAYTVHLEVAYKSKIAAGRTVLCTCEVESAEGRKVWMKATVR